MAFQLWRANISRSSKRLFDEGVQSGELRSDLKPKIAALAPMGLRNLGHCLPHSL